MGRRYGGELELLSLSFMFSFQNTVAVTHSCCPWICTSLSL